MSNTSYRRTPGDAMPGDSGAVTTPGNPSSATSFSQSPLDETTGERATVSQPSAIAAVSAVPDGSVGCIVTATKPRMTHSEPIHSIHVGDSCLNTQSASMDNGMVSDSAGKTHRGAGKAGDEVLKRTSTRGREQAGVCGLHDT